MQTKSIRKSGKISVQIYNEDNQPVYKGDDVTDAEFETHINEKEHIDPLDKLPLGNYNTK